MSEFKELMDEYGRKSDIDDMERLTDVIDKFTHKVKEVAPELEKSLLQKSSYQINVFRGTRNKPNMP